MSIPQSQMFTAEILLLGICGAGGSNSRQTNFSFHYKRPTGSPGLTVAALDAVFQANIVAPIAALLNADWTQVGNSIRFIDDATNAPVLTTHASVGAIAGDRMSTVLSSFQLFQTGVRGKNYRGAKHYFPLSESDTTSGTDDLLNAAALARYATLRTALLTPLTDANTNVWSLCVLSRSLSQLRVNPTTVIVNSVSQVLTNKRIGRMRHRAVKSVY
jgi:hypothetical protein